MARHAILPGLLLTAAFVGAPAGAEPPREIALPADPLGNAIIALSRATGTSIRLTDPTLWQRPVPAIQGRFTTRAALERMLQGADMRVSRIGDGGWQVSAAPPKVTPIPIAITAPDPAPAAPGIIVTGSKRDTRLADYAGTVTILRGSALGEAGPGGSQAIGDRDSSVTSTHLGAGRDKLFIRGVADSGLVGQSQATVGQYLGDLRLTYNAPDPDLRLYDVASVEVLEGPQGTLYGAGSPGGIIRIVRNAPQLDTWQGAVTAGFTATAHGAAGGDGSATINLPLLAGIAALRAVGYADTQGGYIDELGGRKNVNRVNTAGGRAVTRIAPGDGWTIDIGGTYQRIHGDDGQYADRDLPPLTRHSMVAQPYGDHYAMGELTIVKDWDGLRFTSSSAIVRQDVREQFDATSTLGEPGLFSQRDNTRLITTEERLSHPMRNGFGWVVGASFVRNEAHLSRALGPVGELVPSTGVYNRVDEETLYGEASFEPLRGLILTGGARLTHSRLSGRALDPIEPLAFFDTMTQAVRSETRTLPSFSISFRPAEGWLLFSRTQEGFRPGGLSVGDDVVRRFRSDHVLTSEIGIRHDPAEVGTIGFSASFAYTRWRNIQADFLDSQALTVTTNIGDGRILSFDAQASWRPAPGLRIAASIVVNDSRLTRPDYEQLNAFRLYSVLAKVQQQLPNVAELGGRLGADYHHDLGQGFDLTASGWGRYIGKTHLGVGPILGGREGNYVDTGLSVRIGRGRYGMTLSARNLLDTVGNRFALGTPLNVAQNSEVTPLQPRTIRIGFDASF